MDLVEGVYKATSDFPPQEQFGLTRQMRRAAVSVPSNIAEGAARNTAKDFNHFLGIASGSLSELETQLILSKNLGFLPNEILTTLLDELIVVRKLIFGLKRSLKVGGQ